MILPFWIPPFFDNDRTHTTNNRKEKMEESNTHISTVEDFKLGAIKKRFIISQQKHMLWVPNRTSKTDVLTDGPNHIHNFTPFWGMGGVGGVSGLMAYVLVENQV